MKPCVAVNPAGRVEVHDAGRLPDFDSPVVIWYGEQPCVDQQVRVMSGMIEYRRNGKKGQLRFSCREGAFPSKVLSVAISDLAMYDYSAMIVAVHVFFWQFTAKPVVKVHKVPALNGHGKMISAICTTRDCKTTTRLLPWKILAPDTVDEVIEGLVYGPNIGFIDVSVTEA